MTLLLAAAWGYFGWQIVRRFRLMTVGPGEARFDQVGERLRRGVGRVTTGEKREDPHPYGLPRSRVSCLHARHYQLTVSAAPSKPTSCVPGMNPARVEAMSMVRA